MAVDLAHLETLGTPVLPRAPRARRSGYARFALAAAGAMLLAAAAGGVRAQNSIEEPSAPVQPLEFTELSEVSTDVSVPEAPAPSLDEPVRRSTAPAVAAPVDPPASNPGGQTSVVAGNGTEETDTSSGGANVNNSSTVVAETGMASDDPQP